MAETAKDGGRPASHHSRRKVDLTGQRFGTLTVIGPADNIGSRTAWLCRCDCGKEKAVKTDHLRSGHVKSCGRNGCPGCAPGLTYVDGTCVEMLAKRRIRKNNSSGVTGVGRCPDGRGWRASICFKGKRTHLGRFQTFEEAVEARMRAEEEMFGQFLEQHGKE